MSSFTKYGSFVVTTTESGSTRTPAPDQEGTDAIERAFVEQLQRRKRRGLRTLVALNLLGICLFLIAWEILPRIVAKVNILMFPPPSIVIDTLIPLIESGELVSNILISLRRASLGFAIATVLGIAAGLLTARIHVLQQITDPVLHGFRSIPVIALVPLSLIWFGIGEGSKVALIAWGAFFPIWIATFIGVRDVHSVYLRSAASLGAGPMQTMVLVTLPSALPLILAGLRQALAIALIVLVAAEISGARGGIAYMIAISHQLFRVDIMFVGLAVLGALGFLLDRLFVLASRRLFPWYGQDSSV